MNKDLYLFFQKTPKRVLAAMCEDMAMILVGEQESYDNPALVLEYLQHERTVVLENNLVMPPRRRVKRGK